MLDMRHEIQSVLLAAGLVLGMLLAMECGRRIGRHPAFKMPEKVRGRAATLEAAVFGLMGLLIAFTFTGAATRFDHRRHLITEEANAIGTAWLRLDLLPSDSRRELQQLFRDYLDSRLRTYALLPDIGAARAELERSAEIQLAVWGAAVEACLTGAGQVATVVVLPALNQMFDAASTRTAAALTHPPSVVFGLLFLLAVGSSFLIGYDMADGNRDLIHVLGFMATLAVTVYLIMDLEYPRLGLIRVDDFDAILRALRRAMG